MIRYKYHVVKKKPVDFLVFYDKIIVGDAKDMKGQDIHGKEIRRQDLHLC